MNKVDELFPPKKKKKENSIVLIQKQPHTPNKSTA